MSYCLNPNCQKPQNPPQAVFCHTCGSKLLLGERYRAIKPIGAGGFGTTFLGIDQGKPSQPQCAIKQFRPPEGNSRAQEKAAELFRQEASQLEALGKHPQIPDLLGHFEDKGHLSLVEEYIDGQTLAQELQLEGPFNETQIRQLLTELLPVLEFIHEKGVIHRDIKPENIIRRRRDNKLVLVDFGAAKTATSTSLGRTGTVIGSAGYTAPEQSFGKAVFASDIYSLGVTCIHLMTQIPPFDLFDNREGVWVWRDYLVDNSISRQLGQILDRMLETTIGRRYQSAAEVLQDLQPRQVLPQTPVFSPPPQQTSRSQIVQNFSEDSRQNRTGISYILWLAGFAGVGGLHRFYNGKIGTGLLWFCTYNLFGVGQIVDAFLIPGMVEEYEQKMRAKMGLSSLGVPLTEPTGISQTFNPSHPSQLIVKLLQAAKARGGSLSVTQAVMDTGIEFTEVERLLKEMAVAGYVRVAQDRGVVIYRFIEL